MVFFPFTISVRESLAFSHLPERFSRGRPISPGREVSEDPYLWLEDVDSEQALDWVRGENAKTQAALANTPEFTSLRDSLRAILDSTARIPDIIQRGAHYYNFWSDKTNPAGLWRRTTLDEYRKADPDWEIADRPGRAEQGRRRQLGLAWRRLPEAGPCTLPDRAVARRRRRRCHPRIRPGRQAMGQGRVSTVRKPKAPWPGKILTTCMSIPTSEPAR